MDVAWVCHKISNLVPQMMTQLRAHNAGPQNKIQMANTTKYKLTTPLLFPMGIYKKEYCTIFQYPDGCNADEGSLILATSHTHKQK